MPRRWARTGWLPARHPISAIFCGDTSSAGAAPSRQKARGTYGRVWRYAGPMPPEIGPDDLISLNRLTTVARTVVGTAHALNNALQVIAGSAELLAQQKELT